MKISVVLSTYNGEQYIIEQLESIKNQTRLPDEVLIYDDCSTDQTADIAQAYIEKYQLSNWKIKVNEVNKGWKKNFMDGLWSASGDLVFPGDQDDVWVLDKLEIMEKIMVEKPEIKVLTANYTAFYDSGKKVTGPEEEDGKLIQQKIADGFFNTKYPGCTYCIRRDFIELSKKYWEQDFPHDALFWRIGLLSNTLYSYHKSLILWRKHKDSAYTIESMQGKTMQKKREWLNYALRVIEKMECFVKEYNTTDVTQKQEYLAHVRKWINHRVTFYETGSFLDWLRLIPYLKNYDRLRQYVGDLYLVKIKKG